MERRLGIDTRRSRVCIAMSCAAVAVAVASQRAQAAPKWSTDHVAEVKANVVRLEVELVDGGRAGGTGFFVAGAPGLVITNHHVIEGASRVLAVDTTSAQLGEMVAVRLAPEFDLAVLKAKDSTGATRPIPAGAVIRQGDPREGEDVWALGYPTLGFSVTKGVVNAIRPWTEFPEYLRELLTLGTFHRDSVFLQTDCTINPGNSGGPLIDGNGQVVGVATMTVRGLANSNFAMSARHVSELVRAAPATPVPFPTATKTRQRTSATAWPKPLSFDPARDSELRAAFHALSRSAKCSLCAGTGKAKGQRTERSNSPGARGRITTFARNCTACDGKGLGKLEAIRRNSAKFASAFARASMQFDEEPGFRNAVRDVLGDLLDAAASTRVIEELNADGVSRARNEKPGSERAMMMIARFDGRLSGTRDATPPVLLSVGGHGGSTFVVLTSPRLIEGREGQRVFVGGICSGIAILSGGTEVIVLQDGFVVGQR